MSASLSGCAVGPRYVAPASSVATSFPSTAAMDARSTGPTSAELATWWQSFNDPILSALVERALAQNLDLQQAGARVAQARAALSGANASLLPSGSVSANAGRAYQSLETPTGQIASAFGSNRAVSTYDIGVGGSWEIDVFGGKDAARDAVRADWQASAASATAVRLAIAAQTADTYVAIRALQARLALAREQVATQSKLTDLIALQYRRGIAAELQLRQSEGALAQLKASVPALQNDLDRSMNALDVLLGREPGAARGELALAAPIPTPPAISSAGGPTALLRRRPDVIAAERTLAASNARIGAAMAEYYPKFSLSGLLGSATVSLGGLLGSNSLQAGGFLGLRWRLFDFGRVDAEIRAAKGRNAEALAAYRQTVLRASQDVEDAFSTLIQQEVRAAALRDGEASLARARQTSEAAYKGGVVSLIEVLDADRRLLDARDGLIQARAAATRGAIASFRALGGGWQAPKPDGGLDVANR
ncbi:efflux transporter outer membrane subunit [Sphingomonas astaxanthinifaciens]|nr:efflux transporter outer membrane subunit [Sphingomonas astaxanthinifaciens]